MQKLTIITILTFLLQSCLYNYPSTTVNQENELSSDQKSENAVMQHLDGIYKDLYKPYTFGSLYTLKPKEFVELDQLIEIRKQLPEMKDNYGDQLLTKIAETDTLIAQKKREIKEKKIYPLYELEHIYTISDAAKKTYQAVDANFTLYPNYTIKDVQMKFNVALTPNENELFYKFMTRAPMFSNETDPSWAKKQDQNAYATFVNAIDKETDPELRGELVVNSIYISELIRKTNEFNENNVCRLLATRWVVKNVPNIKGKPWEFSQIEKIYSTSDESDSTRTLIGYKQYVLVNTEDENAAIKTVETTAYQFIFDLNFLIRSAHKVAPPYEQYFNKN